MRKALTVLVWAIALIGVLFHAVEMYDYVGGPLSESPSVGQQAAMAAYRTGMMVLFYALGRGITETIKVTLDTDS